MEKVAQFLNITDKNHIIYKIGEINKNKRPQNKNLNEENLKRLLNLYQEDLQLLSNLIQGKKNIQIIPEVSEIFMNGLEYKNKIPQILPQKFEDAPKRNKEKKILKPSSKQIEEKKEKKIESICNPYIFNF